MSFSTPRTKLFVIMKSLGYQEVKDCFDFEEIGNTKINKGFHVRQEPITSDGHEQGSVQVLSPQILSFYMKGNKNTNITMTNILNELNIILNTAMDIANRVDGVRNVLFDQFQAVPHSDDNNDIIRGELTLIYKQVFCFSAS